MKKQAILAELASTIGTDPTRLVEYLAGAKILGANALSMYGHKLGPLRRIGQEVAGFGARTALQGKPAISRLITHPIGLITEPAITNAYHGAYEIGKASGGTLPELREMASQMAEHLPARGHGAAEHALDFVKGIPLDYSGRAGKLRRAADYLATPVSQVAKDIGHGIGRLVPRGKVVPPPPGRLLPNPAKTA